MGHDYRPRSAAIRSQEQHAAVSFQQFTLAGFGLAAATVFALAAVTWNFMQQTLRAADFVAHTQEVLTALRSVDSQMFRAEANQRTYLVDLAPEFSRWRGCWLDAARGGGRAAIALKLHEAAS